MALINGYKRLTYLQGNSSSTYINTGINPSNLIKVDITQYATMGITIGSTNNGTGWLNSIGCSSAQAWYYSGEYNVVRFSNEAINNIIISPTTSEIIVNGTSYSKPHYTFSRNSPMLMFALRDGSSVDYYSDAKVYSCKIWNDGTLVRDFIPVERESDNVLGLYDLVNNVFYTNAGSGTFIKGDYYLETHVVPEGKGTITDGYEGYELLDYIQSSGTQKIATGVNCTQNLKVLLDFQFSTNVDYNNAIGTAYAGQSFLLVQNSNSAMFWFGNGTNFGYGDLNRHTYELTNTYIKRDETTYNLTNTYNNNELYLFGVGSLYSRLMMYSCKMYDGDTLVRDFVPVRRKSDSAIGLLDLVNNQFYGNSGTGTFTAGNVVHKLTAIKKATTKFQNWLVNGYTQLDYIESSGTQYIDSGIVPNTNTNFELDYSLVSNTTARIFGVFYPLGSSGNRGRLSTSYINSTLYFRDKLDYDYNISVVYDTNRHNLKLDGTDFYYDNVLKASNIQKPTNATGTMGLFGFQDQSSYSYGTNRLHFCKVYDNSTLIRDFIPVIRHIDGQIGLLDLVHFKFYGNKGTGEFIGGNVL